MTKTQTVAQMIDEMLMKKELFRVMKESNSYVNDREIITAMLDMREQVRDGDDPEEVLRSCGYEADYVFDLI